jgi:hypothetical protein
VRHAAGYAQVVDPDRPLVEYDTCMCCHCGTHLFVKPNTLSTVYLIFNPTIWQWAEVPGASCWHCMKPVCLACHDRGVCVPLERMLAQAERRQ